MYYLPFLKRSFHKSELAGLQRMGDSQLPFHRLRLPVPTNPLPYCSPKRNHTKCQLVIPSAESEVIDDFKRTFKSRKFLFLFSLYF